ncbi:hydrogenase maturation protease [Streptomyces sp. NPDC057743]|uniref:hydrogenase maturation protease n=1 Tax=Streptomyces sp. NPDC057743 TaxID=3346236 RepID=UPI0036CE12D6
MDAFSHSSARIVVIGIGNDHRRDDGVGWAVVAELERRPLPRGVALFRSDGEPARLITAWAGARLAIVVDAGVATPPQPGRIHRLRGHRARRQRPFGTTSSHGFALDGAVELAQALGRFPAELLVYAVEAADTGLGAGLSPSVAAAVLPLATRIERDLAPHLARHGSAGTESHGKRPQRDGSARERAVEGPNGS